MNQAETHLTLFLSCVAVLTTLGICGGRQRFLDRTIKGDTTIAQEWIEITLEKPLKPERYIQAIILYLEEPYVADLRMDGVIMPLWLLVPTLMFFAACHSQVHSEVRPRQLEAPSPSPSPRDVASLCESIKDIEILPMKDEAVPDPAYNALVSAGVDAIPCLIKKITDETKMKDPRQAPKVGFVFVGDTAFFVLARVAKIDQAGFVELLPLQVRKAYEGGEGIYGYFRYIDENNNRKKLQDAAVKWYENKYGRSLP